MHKRLKLCKVIVGDVIPDLVFLFMLTSIGCVLCTCVCEREVLVLIVSLILNI